MDKIECQSYNPLRHAHDVIDLWTRALGEQYPVTERVWRPRLVQRASLKAGDGILARIDGRLVGFGIVEIDRAALQPPRAASIQLLLVDPAHQRRGIGSRLLELMESRARDAGMTEMLACGGLHRFWTGVPDDLPRAAAFFAARGYAAQSTAIDMAGPVTGYRMPDAMHTRMEADGLTLAGMSAADLGAVYDFLTREAPGWRGSMLQYVHHGDLDDVRVMRRGEEIVGCIQTYTPGTRYRGANVVWEGRYGRQIGGFGAVLIAAAQRGRGLGELLIHAAAEYIAARGASACYIDWTSEALAPFYGKVGASICSRFAMYAKTLVHADQGRAGA